MQKAARRLVQLQLFKAILKRAMNDHSQTCQNNSQNYKLYCASYVDQCGIFNGLL